MQIRSSSRLVSNPSSNPTPSTNPNPKGRNRRRSKQRIEEFNLEELSPPIVTMADQRTMAQLLQAPFEDAIVVPAITADNFELKHGLLTLVQNKQFFGHDKEDPHAHIRYFNKITSTLKFPNVLNMSIKLMLFHFPSRVQPGFGWRKNPLDRFLLGMIFEAWDGFKDLFRACPHHALNWKDQDSLNSAAGGNFLDKMPRECLAITESKSKVCYSRNKPVVAKVSTNTSTSSISPDVAELKDMVKALLLDKKNQNQAPATVKAVEESCVTCGGAHSYRNCLATDGNVYRDNIQEFISQASVVNYNQANTSYRLPMMSNQIRPPGFPPVPNKVVENEPDATKDTVTPPNNESTEDIQPLVVLTESLILTSEPVNSLTIKPIASPVIAPRPNQRPSIPYPSRLQDQKLRDKANDQREKFSQIFKDLNFNISFVDALILMPKFGPSIKILMTNKDKLCELARTLLNAHFSMVLLKKLPKKLGDPGKFLISCDFLEKAECLALADFGASINRMPLSVWDQLSLPDLSLTCMTLELVGRSISRSVGVVEDVYVKVDIFHFLTDFIVIDFDVNPRVPLILGRSFLKTERALIDVFEGELTLCVGKDAITFNLDQTSRYSANYNDMTAKRIDVIDMACEEYSQNLLGFSNVIASGNPTPYYDLIVSTTSLTLTPFENSDFLLQEVDAFLALEDDPTSPKVDQSYLDSEGDILLLEAFLNDDPSLPPPNQGNYLPEVRKELKICEAKYDKSSIDEPLEVKLKDLPPHLEYVFLEGDDKLPVIIEKDLSIEDNADLITVLKSHKRAIAWKLSNIKDQEKTIFTCPYRTFTYRRMPFGLCNAPGTFQRCMMAIFHDMIEKTMEVFMDDFSVFGNSFQSCLSHLERMLKRIEVDKAKVDVITKLPHPTIVKGIRSFLGHAVFYRRFIKDFCKIARPMTRLLKKDTLFIFFKECVEAFQTLKRKLTEAPILIAPDWNMPFELMCDASDFAISAVLGQRQDKHFRPIHYASKTMTEVESNYTITEKEMLAVVYAFKKFRFYLFMNKSILYTDHSALKYLFAKKDSKAGLLRWVLLLQEFTFKVIDTKGVENLAADHLS
uniref:RNA-directed DNA polymerase n=1 Tax=Tanacetum cinerariifolium TaxID=118510 RepID=A0A699GYS2_TANCI|nr:reverse transcriptase domain-containing protein [Tanacetum cinerariifolium]